MSHEIQDLLKAPNPNNLEESSQKVSMILDIAQTVTNTNSFMMMTINRCIDYNKTMHGLKLQPRVDIVNLNDSLLFPISCIKTLSSKEKLPIEILPIPEEIHNFIHTDKQWLQENLLCLLSNAVQYSERGNVTLKLYLQKSTTKTYPIPIELISLMSKPRKKPTNKKKQFKNEKSGVVAISKHK